MKWKISGELGYEVVGNNEQMTPHMLATVLLGEICIGHLIAFWQSRGHL